MSSPNCLSGFPYTVRRTRRSWSVSESDARSLTTVDEEEIFLFDDDDLRSQRQPFRKTLSNDLESINFSTEIPTGNDVINLSKNKTENVDFQRRFNFYESKDQFKAGSPSQELGSSAESERSTIISIEGLREHLHSCFTCGVHWKEDHASLDCHECGGYALDRPCLDCNGSCPAIWNRDLGASHQFRKAKWIGKCKLKVRNVSMEL